jgi:hypothetical protein
VNGPPRGAAFLLVRAFFTAFRADENGRLTFLMV